MITTLDHVAILTANIEEAVAFYAELLGCPPPTIGRVDRPGLRLRSAMLPIGPTGATRLQIIEPQEGPGVAELARGGEGTIFEIGLQVDDAAAFHDRMAAQGIAPVDMTGEPLSGQFVVSSLGNRYLLLPTERTRGTRLEFLQLMK